MCSRNHRSEGPRNETMEREKFYKHLKMFLIFNAVFFFLSMKNGGHSSFIYVTFFWGIAVANHYFKVFGNRGYQEPYDDFMGDLDDSISESFSEKRKKPRWRDKDLV